MNNKESLLRYIESVHMGVKGLVVDADTGKPIEGAQVEKLIIYYYRARHNGWQWAIVLKLISFY